MRSFVYSFLYLVVLGSFCLPHVEGACGGGGRSRGGRGGAVRPTLPVVAWAKDAKEAIDTGTTNDKPVLLYFCSSDSSMVAGTGEKGWRSFRKTNPKKTLLKQTVFESPAILASFKKAGLDTFAKVPATKENKALFTKYGAGLDTLVVVAPGGKKLKTYFGRSIAKGPLIKSMQSFKKDFATWKKSNPTQKSATK